VSPLGSLRGQPHAVTSFDDTDELGAPTDADESDVNGEVNSEPDHAGITEQPGPGPGPKPKRNPVDAYLESAEAAQTARQQRGASTPNPVDAYLDTARLSTASETTSTPKPPVDEGPGPYTADVMKAFKPGLPWRSNRERTSSFPIIAISGSR